METKQETERLLAEFKHLFRRYEVQEYIQKNGKRILIAKVAFEDCSKLETFESEWENKHKYQYQWMREDNSLIISWGNDSHHPEIATHPHHKHVGARDNVQPSEETTLRKVLNFIAKTLGML